LADVERDFFKGFQTIHNKRTLFWKNNFITGTTRSTLVKDDQEILEETVQIHLMPHQTFIFPKTWIYRIANGPELQNNGLEYYDTAVTT